jgi:hypothetical protein
MKTPKAPASPDPTTVAKAQTDANVNTGVSNAYLNNANYVGPYGSVTNKQTGSFTVDGRQIPQFTQTTTLSPQQQKLLDQQMQLYGTMGDTANAQFGRLNDVLSQPISTSGLQTERATGGVAAPRYQQYKGSTPQLSQYTGSTPQLSQMQNDDFSQDRLRVEDAINSRLEPQIQRDRAALESQLANQGIMPESEAFREAIALSDRGRNDARMQTVLAGGQEQSRMFGLDQSRTGFNNNVAQQGFQNSLTRTGFNNDVSQQGFQNNLTRTGFNNDVQGRQFDANMDSMNFQNSLRDQELAELMRVRGGNLNEVMGLMSGSQVQTPNAPAYRGGTIAGTDTAGIAQQGYQNDLARYQQKVAQQNALMGGISGLIGTAATLPFGGGGGSLFGGIGQA